MIRKSNLSICINFMHVRTTYSCWIGQILCLAFEYPHMEFEFESLVQTNFISSGFSCISSNHSMLPCHDHASYWYITLIVFRLYLPVLFPLSGRCSDVVIVDTDEELYYFRSVRQAKPPCSFRYNPTLSLLLSFTALGQRRFNCYMLR